MLTYAADIERPLRVELLGLAFGSTFVLFGLTAVVWSLIA